MSAHGLEQGRRPLTIEEVREAGRPAIFSAFGDHLVYLDGIIYALPREPDPSELADLPHLSGAYEMTTVVGIEYGWYELAACTRAPETEAPPQAVLPRGIPVSRRQVDQRGRWPLLLAASRRLRSLSVWG